MRCKICSGNISTWTVISASPQRDGPPRVTCGSCGSVFRIKGIYVGVVAPLILLTFFPYRMLPNSQVLETLILAFVVLLLYWLSFLVFIKLEREDQTREHNSELTPRTDSKDSKGSVTQ